MKAISFADKEKMLPLQAADLLAYRMRQTSKNMSEKIWMPKELDRILLKNVLKTINGQADVRRSNWRSLFQSKIEDERKKGNRI